MNHIVLVEPDIPQNTGNIARTCAITGTRLHLIRPLGFSLDQKTLRRSGLDYWKHLDLEIHDCFEDFYSKYSHLPIYILTTHAKKDMWSADFREDCVIVFGSESKGLDNYFHNKFRDTSIKIYMKEHSDLRSLNLANSCAITIYEVLRQQNLNKI